MADEPNVSYSIKEIFEDIKNRLIHIEIKLDAKADREELTALEKRVIVLETSQITDDAVSKYRKWLIGAVVAIAVTLLGGIANLFISIIKWVTGTP